MDEGLEVVPREVQAMIAFHLAQDLRGVATARSVCRFWNEEVGGDKVWESIMRRQDWSWRLNFTRDTNPTDVLNISRRTKLRNVNTVSAINKSVAQTGANDRMFTWEQYCFVHMMLLLSRAWADRNQRLALFAHLHVKNGAVIEAKARLPSTGTRRNPMSLYIPYTHATSELTAGERQNDWRWLEDSVFLLLQNQEMLAQALDTATPQPKDAAELHEMTRLAFISNGLEESLRRDSQRSLSEFTSFFAGQAKAWPQKSGPA